MQRTWEEFKRDYQYDIKRVKTLFANKNYSYETRKKGLSSYLTPMRKAYLFIEKLYKAGVPLSEINCNDWVDAPVRVYIRMKPFNRFEERDLIRAKDFAFNQSLLSKSKQKQKVRV